MSLSCSPCTRRREENSPQSPDSLKRRPMQQQLYLCPLLGVRLSRSLAWLLGVAANNLDLVRLHRLAAVVHLERHILDEEGPHLVTESIRVEAPLL